MTAASFSMLMRIGKMATGLSEEEFHRMQLQLIELRTANYELESKQKQSERDLVSWREKSEVLDKELQKALKAINKSKKIKEVDLLLQENDQLQLKLQSQEDDFRLQNQTLMNELSILVTKNEDLEKEITSAKGGNKEEAVRNTDDSGFHDEIRRLKAENAALQKNLTTHQAKYEKELSNLHDSLQHQRALNANPDHVTKHDDMTEDGDITSGSESFGDTYTEKDSDESNGNGNKSGKTVEDYLREINELNVKLDTELEEKKLLKNQLSEFGKKEKGEGSALKEEVDKLKDKLRKKQESLVQLQEEKEQLYTESSIKVEELQAARERDQKHYTDQINKLKQELDRATQAYTQLELSSSEKIKELEDSLPTLKAQVTAETAETHQLLSGENTQLKGQLAAREQEIATLTHQKDDLLTQLSECQNASQTAMDQLYEVQKDRDSQIQALQEANKVAEKRKSLLDDLAIRFQKDADVHRDKVQSMEEEFEAELGAVTQQLQAEKERSAELERCRKSLEDVKSQLLSAEEAKGWLERRLAESEETFANTEKKLEERLASVEEAHLVEVEEMKAAHQLLTQEHEQVVDGLRSEVKAKEDAMKRLKQEIKDNVDDKKIHEKKGVVMLKDLKRQLHSERKRAEKLQERLQEVLSDSRNKGMEELFNQSDASFSDALHGDGSSVSSWSAGASGVTKDTSSACQSPDRSHSTDPDREGEHSDLLQRMAHIQQQKWDLEEKVLHLETSNAAMCDDLLQKSAIIEHYVMDGRTDKHRHNSDHGDKKLSLKKVLDIVNKGDEEAKEMNRKLQRMLEETLTKNMHLQKDLEVLSEEVVRLSKTQKIVSTNGSSDCLNTDQLQPGTQQRQADSAESS